MLLNNKIQKFREQVNKLLKNICQLENNTLKKS
jgi:hypothetical protein